MSHHESEIFGGEDDDNGNRNKPSDDSIRSVVDSTTVQEALGRARRRQHDEAFFAGWLRRNGLKPEPIQIVTGESVDEIPPDNTKQKPVKVKAESGVDGYQRTIMLELEAKLESSNFPSDLNARAAPQAFKAGYQRGIREALALVKAPIYLEPKR